MKYLRSLSININIRTTLKFHQTARDYLFLIYEILTLLSFDCAENFLIVTFGDDSFRYYLSVTREKAGLCIINENEALMFSFFVK